MKHECSGVANADHPCNQQVREDLFQWPLRAIQKLFITAIFLPLSLIGAAILIYQRRLQPLAILLIVPCYYFCTQSALHTEYRYVLVIHYFLFVLAAVSVYAIGCQIKQSLLKNAVFNTDQFLFVSEIIEHMPARRKCATVRRDLERNQDVQTVD